MELRQIKYLLEIVRRGGFTRAAESLGIAQPSLTIAVQKLEEEFGVTLINRQQRKISLTAEGRVFCERARQIEEQVLGVVQEMEEFRGLKRGEIRMGIPGMLGTHFFPSRIAQFRRQYPRLKLSVHSDGANTIQGMIESGELDVGVVARSELPDTIAWRPLIREEMVACMASGHPLAAQGAITLAELAREPLALFSEGYFQRQHLTSVMAEAGLQPRVVFETNLVPLLKEVVAGGGGMTTLLKMAAGEPGLTALPFDPPLYVEAVIVWKKNAYLSKATRALLEFMVPMEDTGDPPQNRETAPSAAPPVLSSGNSPPPGSG